MNYIKNSIVQKKWLVFAGILWIAYLLFHMLTLLNFHQGSEAFNNFYLWYEDSLLHSLIILSLILSLVVHVFIALKRQLSNHQANGKTRYAKRYPGDIPRFIVFSGVIFLLTFIIFHYIQMELMSREDLYISLKSVLSEPLFALIYLLGVTTVTFHMYHGIKNIPLSLGLNHVEFEKTSIVISGAIAIGFLSLLAGVYYA